MNEILITMEQAETNNKTKGNEMDTTTAPPPPKRIIVLDDEETMRDLIKLFIERHTPNIAFEMCKNGNEAMDRLLDGNPAMFITDICHPKLDAYAMLTWIESRQAAFPIIIVSGNDAACLMDRFASTLNIQFFPKPIKIEDFSNLFPTANASDKKIPHHE